MLKIIATKQTHLLKPYVYTSQFRSSGYMKIDFIFWTLQIYHTSLWENYLNGK